MSNTFIRLKNIAEQNEETNFYHLAAFSKNHSQGSEVNDNFHLAYKSDVDKIVHSKSFARYNDKTQVVYLVENDHITHRSLHVQLVSNFSRGIAKNLRLNVDLVEAISLGHDVGHPPFGHEGEKYLSLISKKHGNGSFSHPLQSCRLLSEIEPLNLGLAVYDGFLCHDGGMNGNVIRPVWDKTWEDHFLDRQIKKEDPNQNLTPATLEGALVKFCDTMSYVGKDIEDAISLDILTREEVPKTILGNNNFDILNNLAKDMILHSYEKDCIAISNESFEALKTLRTFNFRNIYTHPKLKVESEKIKNSYRILFEILLEDYEKKEQNSYLWNNYLFNKNLDYVHKTVPVQLVVDFIAGMTDKYFVKTLENLIIPKNIKL